MKPWILFLIAIPIGAAIDIAAHWLIDRHRRARLARRAGGKPK